MQPINLTKSMQIPQPFSNGQENKTQDKFITVKKPVRVCMFQGF